MMGTEHRMKTNNSNNNTNASIQPEKKPRNEIYWNTFHEIYANTEIELNFCPSTKWWWYVSCCYNVEHFYERINTSTEDKEKTSRCYWPVRQKNYSLFNAFNIEGNTNFSEIYLKVSEEIKWNEEKKSVSQIIGLKMKKFICALAEQI